MRPCAWAKASLSYKYEDTGYRTDTDPEGLRVSNDVTPGGWLNSAHYHGNTYSLNAVLTPWRRLDLSGTVSYQETRIAAFANGNPAIVPYRGERLSVLSSATYALNQTTDLIATYNFSWADYSQDNFTAGLPLGIHYREHALTAGVARRLSKNVTAKLRYGFYVYEEPSSGDTSNFTAHALFGTLVVRLP
jgi:hypothetical protein